MSYELINAPLLDLAIKGAAILAAGHLLVLALRRGSAAARHLVLMLSMLAVLLLPLLAISLPQWNALPAHSRPRNVRLLDTNIVTAPAEQPALEAAPTAPPPDMPTQVSAPRIAASFDWRQWVLPVWFAGVGLCLWPLIVGSLSLALLRRRCEVIEDGSWRSLLDQCAKQLQLRRPVLLLRSDQRTMPMTWGAFSGAKLLMPAEADDWSADQRRAVMLHELGHVKRRDCLTHVLCQITCAAHWFNPLAWWALHRMRTLRESACDDLVLASMETTSGGGGGGKASDYAQQLLDLATRLRAPALSAYASIAMARPSVLEGRLLAILDPRKCRKAVTRRAMLGATLLCLLIAAPVAMLRAAEPEATSAEPLPAPVQTVARFVNLALANQDGQAKAIMEPGKEYHGGDLREAFADQPFLVQQAYADEQSAMVLSPSMALDHGRVGPIIFRLIQIEGTWRIRDIDVETTDAADAQIEGYCQNPQVKLVFENKHAAAAQLDLKQAVIGTWRIVSVVDSGRISPEQDIAKVRVVFDGSTMKIVPLEMTDLGSGAGQGDVSSYTIDVSVTPAHFDLTGHQQKIAKGLIELRGRQLHIVIPEVSEERATAFESKPDSPNDVYMVLERAEAMTAQDDAAAAVDDVATAVEHAVNTISQCSEGDPRVQQAIDTLQPLDGKRVVAELTAHLDDSPVTRLRAAIYILWQGKFQNIDAAAPKLLELTGSDEPFTAGMSALALGQQKVAAAYDRLVDLVQHHDSGYVRRCAAIALGWLGDQRAREVLTAVISNDNDPLVVANAQAGLAALQAAVESSAESQRDRIIVEDLARELMVAIRDKDDAAFAKLATDQVTPGWIDALPHFALELREQYRAHNDGKPMNVILITEAIVDGRGAVAKFPGPSGETGTYLALFFVKTSDGWRNYLFRNAPPNVTLAEMLAKYPPKDLQ